MIRPELLRHHAQCKPDSGCEVCEVIGEVKRLRRRIWRAKDYLRWYIGSEEDTVRVAFVTPTRKEKARAALAGGGDRG